MTSSAVVGLLAGIAELARRHGLRPSEVDAILTLDHNGENSRGVERLEFISHPVDEERYEKFNKIKELLGCSHDGILETSKLIEMEDIVEKAIALSPRVRSL